MRRNSANTLGNVPQATPQRECFLGNGKENQYLLAKLACSPMFMQDEGAANY
jgi:hypothetical protein